MISGRQKRLLLGLLALLAPLPLPFNEPRPEGVVGIPYLAAYLLAVGVLLVRVRRGIHRPIGALALNLLGLAYLPYLFLDLTLLWRGSLVRPMMHLALFALAAKLWSMDSDREKWQVTVGVFFVFLASMATSTHPTIVVYLVAFSALALLLLTRYAYFHLLGVEAVRGRLILGPRSIKRYVAAFATLAVVLAIPIFLLLPRIRGPYLPTTAGGPGGVGPGTGFSDQVTLDVIGNIRASREVALRLQVDGDRLPASDFRLKGATYDRYAGVSWVKSALDRVLSPRGGRFELAEGEPVQSLRIWLQPLRAHSLVLPVETLGLRLDLPALQRDLGGALSMDHQPREILEYEVELAAEPRLTGRPPEVDSPRDRSSDPDGVSEPIRRLALEVAGDGPAAEQARRIESHLISEYEYTLDLLRRSTQSPIEDFLFEYRSGHCEYFASAMVLMLRAVGIPARFVTGFLGAEYNPFEGYYIVRQSNAHAWVEAWIPDRGWQTFDPTPPSGRPSSAEPSLGLLMRQAWDWTVFRWDRYVISFTAYDQGLLLASLRQRLRELGDRWRRMTGTAPEGAPVGVASTPDSRSQPISATALALLAAVAALLLVVGAWRTRPPLSATRAFTRLRAVARSRGVELGPALPPQAACVRLVERFPEAREPAARLLQLYLLESFRGQELEEAQRAEVGRSLQEAVRTLRRAS